MINIDIPDDLDPALIPLAFLLGSWQGPGVGDGITSYVMRLDIAVVPGRSVLSHVFTATGEDGLVRTELGFWRPGENLADVEFQSVDADGFAQVCYGRAQGLKLEVGSDAVVRTSSGAEVSATRHLYGKVESDLAFAVDRASDGDWTSYISARLQPA